MTQKTWGPFNGTQLTILLTAAILAIIPTTLWSVDAFTNVAIQDPINGKKVAVDAARRLFVYDQVADWDETPANFVTASSSFFAGCTNLFTVPAGKALIIKSAHVHSNMANQASVFVDVTLLSGVNCGGPNIAYARTNQVNHTQVLDFGNGIAIPAGRTVSGSAFNAAGIVFIYGYLVPAGWVPASAAATAALNPATMVVAPD